LLKLRRFILIVAASATASLYAQVRLSTEEDAKLVVEKPDAIYSPLAKQLKLQGDVKVEVTVSEAGMVTSTKVISGHPLLVTAALDAIKKYRYSPYTADGKATRLMVPMVVSFSAGIPKKMYEEQQAANEKYFKEEGKCHGLLKATKWSDAEQVCKAAVPLAEQLGAHQGLTKMGAYEHVGYALLAQQRYGEALEYYNRAFEFARSSLKEADAELGYAYRNLAMAHHGLRNLEKARELYRKAEATLQLAYENIESARWRPLPRNYAAAPPRVRSTGFTSELVLCFRLPGAGLE
jgi:TonB family protein